MLQKLLLQAPITAKSYYCEAAQQTCQSAAGKEYDIAQAGSLI
jgi:hypothetical protein